jgi:hypothetical protein
VRAKRYEMGKRPLTPLTASGGTVENSVQVQTIRNGQTTVDTVDAQTMRNGEMTVDTVDKGCGKLCKLLKNKGGNACHRCGNAQVCRAKCIKDKGLEGGVNGVNAFSRPPHIGLNPTASDPRKKQPKSSTPIRVSILPLTPLTPLTSLVPQGFSPSTVRHHFTINR